MATIPKAESDRFIELLVSARNLPGYGAAREGEITAFLNWAASKFLDGNVSDEQGEL